jgi:hypothetical protein
VYYNTNRILQYNLAGWLDLGEQLRKSAPMQLQDFFKALGQQGNDLEDIADNAVIGDIENWCGRIPINGDDGL